MQLTRWLRRAIAKTDVPKSNGRSLIFCEPGQYVSLSYGTRLDSRPDAKIVVFGLPKSGNAWLVSLLSDYTGLKPVDPIASPDQPGVGMCHLPYSEQLGNRSDFLHAVYILRDLRDIIVSYFHNSQRPDFRSGFPHFHYINIDQFYFEWFLPRVDVFHRIESHAEEFTKRGIPVVRYEQLHDQPAREFARLIRRLGLPIDDDKIETVVQNNTIERLSTTGKQLNVFLPPAHFRKGGYGSYKTELPPNVLSHVNSYFRPQLIRWGYKID